MTNAREKEIGEPAAAALTRLVRAHRNECNYLGACAQKVGSGSYDLILSLLLFYATSAKQYTWQIYQ
jgi:hypothetical protein